MANGCISEHIAADDAISNAPHRCGVENIPPVAHSGSKRLSAAGGAISETALDWSLYYLDDPILIFLQFGSAPFFQ
ncbi:unnamed protein product [Urochloa humidicola]